jgi:ribosomal protein S14
MKAVFVKERKRRLKIELFEEKKVCLKSLKHNRKLGLIWWSRHKLSVFRGRRVNTRCIITGRGKAINKTFKLSRIEFRRWTILNILPGVIKASW